MVNKQVEYDASLWAERDALREQRLETRLRRQAAQRGYKLVPLEEEPAVNLWKVGVPVEVPQKHCPLPLRQPRTIVAEMRLFEKEKSLKVFIISSFSLQNHWLENDKNVSIIICMF